MSYVDAGFDQWFSGAGRFGVFVIATLMIAAFVVLTPRRMTWFTALGGATMTVYLLHSFVLAPLRQTEILSGAVAWWHLGVLASPSFWRSPSSHDFSRY
jgi:fucose 4-O-acetylase-like acetyltransferase